MAPAGQGQAWSHVLCCIKCDKRFSSEDLPVNLACGHVICKSCVPSLSRTCPIDETSGTHPFEEYPVNVPLLSICVKDFEEELPHWHLANNELKKTLSSVEKDMLRLSSFLKKAESERGGSVFSELLSRTMQRKLVNLICFQLVEDEGRSRALKTCRALVDRIVAEIIAINSASNPSTQLWSEVRARGCQFLGPAMQEDVLKLILLALGNGAQIARKTLVIYVVQQMTEDYPQVSKTCVGHVVQLLYRASCFHVIKRDGESSLMQLKDEFRSYEALRKEHDTQIVQMAIEAGLRISPDQWSSLLYGDFQHRSHMQSIIDKLHLPSNDQLCLEEIENYASHGDPLLIEMLKYLSVFRDVNPFYIEHVPWAQFSEAVFALACALELHVSYIKRKHELKQKQKAWRTPKKEEKAAAYVTTRYKTKMCRDVARGQPCPRGNRCTYAHSAGEIHSSFADMPPPVAISQIPSHHVPPLVSQTIDSGSNGSKLPGEQNYTRAPHPGKVTAVPPNVGMQRVQIIRTAPNPMAPLPAHFIPTPPQEVVPMMPIVPVVPAPNGPHAVQMQPPAMVLMTHPPPGNVMMPPKIWQSSQQTLFIHPTSPQHPTFWLPAQNPGYQLENARDSLSKMDLRAEPDADQLVMKRKEILSRLAPFTLTDDEDGDDSIGHVSYTVASSVLDERMELHPHPLVVIGRPPIELPPLPTAVMSPNPNEESICCFSMMGTPDMVAGLARNRASSVPFISSVPISCPETLVSPDGTSVATVQADCGAMQICDTICQPLPTAVSTVAFIPTIGGDHVAVMQPAPPPTLLDAQGVVSNSLDKIVDVKERLNEVDSAAMSSAVSQQLRVELQIAEREMDLLDPRTQASCLLRELRQVDRELERIEACRPAE
ncbi:unnamed protein product [Auanema sp. JU1783]|nr:unnamed protein product [Auanema sp. JU1783]